MDKKGRKKILFLDTKSPSYQKALDACKRVAQSNANVLLIGESGAGKDVAAQYIHALSKRADLPFVAVNCNAYTESLLETELFGHEQGAYTGAVKSRMGKFELADRGTLFLDEVGDINLTIQVKLLRVLETKEIERIGGNNTKRLDFRLIAATNQDLPARVRNGTFREDFFYRISTIVVRIPPLRERQEDLMDMIQFFLQEAQEANQIPIDKVEKEVWDFLLNYDYPGNVRELKNTIDRMVVLSQNHVITKEGIPVLYNLHRPSEKSTPFGANHTEILTWREFKKHSEQEYLSWVLNQMGWNITASANILQISSRQLFNKINEYGLKK